ncbi:hypothetical protein EYF80_018164 [Liparis tanakae]|uniref:Uncharacterized protein n=1 Tax=Liparis tanakae TaxID=230148 RepID=A0A4Z2I0J7_9TELE|nr:hypothetical protein EYF80_018164 [Liparis tanakae]
MMYGVVTVADDNGDTNLQDRVASGAVRLLPNLKKLVGKALGHQHARVCKPASVWAAPVYEQLLRLADGVGLDWIHTSCQTDSYPQQSDHQHSPVLNGGADERLQLVRKQATSDYRSIANSLGRSGIYSSPERRTLYPYAGVTARQENREITFAQAVGCIFGEMPRRATAPAPHVAVTCPFCLTSVFCLTRSISTNPVQGSQEKSNSECLLLVSQGG